MDGLYFDVIDLGDVLIELSVGFFVMFNKERAHLNVDSVLGKPVSGSAQLLNRNGEGSVGIGFRSGHPWTGEAVHISDGLPLSSVANDQSEFQEVLFQDLMLDL